MTADNMTLSSQIKQAAKKAQAYLKAESAEWPDVATLQDTFVFDEPAAEYMAIANPSNTLSLIAFHEAREKKFVKALKVFADLANQFTASPDDGWIWKAEEPFEITVGDLRRAAKAVEGEV